MHDLAVRGGALLLFVGILAGGYVAADQAFGTAAPGGPAGAAGGVQLAAVDASKLASPGTAVTFPVVVRNPGGEPVEVALRAGEAGGLAVEASPATLRVPAGGGAGTFVTVTISAAHDAATVRVPLQATVGGQVRATVPLALTVARPAVAAQDGDLVQADYVGRFPNGTVFDTSVRGVGEGPFAKPAGFGREYQPLSVQLGAQAGTIEGFWRGLLGMGQGQSKTITLAPEAAYGNATQRVEVPRTQEVPRLSQAYERVQTFPRTLPVIASQLNETSQVGDTITVRDPTGNDRRYIVEALDPANVTIRWVVAPGDPFTVYPVWPNQSRAAEVTDTTVVFRTDPANPEQPVTWYSFWPNMTAVANITETAIVLRHDPPEGLAFELPRRGGGAPAQGRVLTVEPGRIWVEAPNEHPLAGETLVFDVTVVRLQRNP